MKHRNLSNSYLKLYRIEALSEQDFKCAYCKEPLTVKTATADHRWPRARRGGTTSRNIAAACMPCNQAKGSMSDIEVYRALRKKHPPRDLGLAVMWASQRIWKRTRIACDRIERFAR